MSGLASALDERPQVGLTSRPSRRQGRKQKLPPLCDGQTIICPRCRTKASILDYETLPEMPAYQHETVPVIQCRCTYIFALRSTPISMPRRSL